MHRNELFMYGNSPDMRENSAEKNLSMEMSLFLYGNSAEMRETDRNSAGKNRAWK